jgi:RNA polymerase sigma-70 factor (ECF subfamily)
LSASATLDPTIAAAPAPSPEASSAALLYERYYDRVFGYCLYQLGSREEAEDAAQTTFMWAFRGLRRGVVPRAEASWLFTIAQNSCRARHRSRGRRRDREVVSDPQLLADLAPAHASQHDELIGLEDALARMPELQRRAILLREWRGLSYKEIAAELELTGAAVETLIFRARRSLAQLLGGPQAPKRARRFAFDFGSIGAALKTALGTGTAAKVAAGVAAAVVATTIAGSSEQLRSAGAETPAQIAAVRQAEQLPLSTQAAAHNATTERGKATPTAKPTRKGGSKHPQPPQDGSGTPAADDPTSSLPPAVENTIGTVAKSVNQTVDSVTDALPPVVQDALPPAVQDALPPLPGDPLP